MWHGASCVELSVRERSMRDSRLQTAEPTEERRTVDAAASAPRRVHIAHRRPVDIPGKAATVSDIGDGCMRRLEIRGTAFTFRGGGCRAWPCGTHLAHTHIRQAFLHSPPLSPPHEPRLPANPRGARPFSGASVPEPTSLELRNGTLFQFHIVCARLSVFGFVNLL